MMIRHIQLGVRTLRFVPPPCRLAARCLDPVAREVPLQAHATPRLGLTTGYA